MSFPTVGLGSNQPYPNMNPAAIEERIRAYKNLPKSEKKNHIAELVSRIIAAEQKGVISRAALRHEYGIETGYLLPETSIRNRIAATQNKGLLSASMRYQIQFDKKKRKLDEASPSRHNSLEMGRELSTCRDWVFVPGLMGKRAPTDRPPKRLDPSSKLTESSFEIVETGGRDKPDKSVSSFEPSFDPFPNLFVETLAAYNTTLEKLDPVNQDSENLGDLGENDGSRFNDLPFMPSPTALDSDSNAQNSDFVDPVAEAPFSSGTAAASLDVSSMPPRIPVTGRQINSSDETSAVYGTSSEKLDGTSPEAENLEDLGESAVSLFNDLPFMPSPKAQNTDSNVENEDFGLFEPVAEAPSSLEPSAAGSLDSSGTNDEARLKKKAEYEAYCRENGIGFIPSDSMVQKDVSSQSSSVSGYRRFGSNFFFFNII